MNLRTSPQRAALQNDHVSTSLLARLLRSPLFKFNRDENWRSFWAAASVLCWRGRVAEGESWSADCNTSFTDLRGNTPSFYVYRTLHINTYAVCAHLMRETESCSNSECTYIDAETSSAYFVLLNLRRRVLPEKLTGSQPVKNFPAFYGTLRTITAFTNARHLSLFWARSIQFMPPSHFFKTHYNITLPSTPRSSKWLFPSGLHNKTLYACFLSRVRASCTASFILLDLIKNWWVHKIKLLVMYLLHSPINSPLLSPNTFLGAPLFCLAMPSNLTV